MTLSGKAIGAQKRKFRKHLPTHIMPQMKIFGERNIRPMMKKTTENWRSAPEFVVEVKRTGGDEATLFVYPGGGDKDAKKWVWLNEGTSARYVVMSQKFGRKTNPWSLSSGSGNPPYDPVKMTPSNRPRPGIEPRAWTTIINAKQFPQFVRFINSYIIRITK